MGSLAEVGGNGLFPKAPGPVLIEINQLESQLRAKEMELGVAHSEIKTLKGAELYKDKAIVELSNELMKHDEKLRSTEKNLEFKNLELKKLTNEKKEALAAQYAAEATVRRVHTAQKEEELVSVSSVIAPLESEIKMHKNEITVLQEDNKALARLTKSKEAALIEAEKKLYKALEGVMLVDNLQNQNLELKRQIEIFQEENKVQEKRNRQKVVEIEKLSQTIRELEESILAGGVAANAVRDYQRQICELNEEKRTLGRELARARVSTSRVASTLANEWKDENEKVIPIKQWLEERKFLQAEIQRLRDKVSISDRTAKAEAQFQDKLKVRLKTLEEGLKQIPSPPIKRDENSRQTFGSSTHNGTPKMRSSSQPRASVASGMTSVPHRPSSPSRTIETPRSVKRTNIFKSKLSPDENLIRKNLWAPRSKFTDDSAKENTERIVRSNGKEDDITPAGTEASQEIEANGCGHVELRNKGGPECNCEDSVSGFLYDRLQKEVINLRKLHEEKDGLLIAKDDQIKLLLKQVDTLMKAMEVESKKIRREAAAREKEASCKSENNKQNIRSTSTSRRIVKHHEASSTARN